MRSRETCWKRERSVLQFGRDSVDGGSLSMREDFVLLASCHSRRRNPLAKFSLKATRTVA